jgi:5-methyltetrahydropteroyltriglutamate--homocysteine methyltransferase
MKRSDDRILTTHTGSLPRPPDLLDMIQKRDAGEPIDSDAIARDAAPASAPCRKRHRLARRTAKTTDELFLATNWTALARLSHTSTHFDLAWRLVTARQELLKRMPT